MPFHHAENRNSTVIVNCHKCKDIVNEIQNYLECDGCRKKFHLRCAGVAGINITRASFSDTWYCKDCKKTSTPEPESQKRKAHEISPENVNNLKKINNSETPKKTTVSDEKLDLILKELSIVKSSNVEVKQMISVVQENQQFLSDEFDTFKKKLDNLFKDNEKFKKKLNVFEIKQNEHSTIINNLESELDTFKQIHLANNAVIGGLPHNVDPNTAISNIMKVLKTECQIEDVADSYFLYNKNNNNSKTSNNKTTAPQLLVKFKTYEAKTDLIKMKKTKGSLLCTEVGLNTASDKQIYIRDHVTAFKMNLFNECKEIKKNSTLNTSGWTVRKSS